MQAWKMGLRQQLGFGEFRFLSDNFYGFILNDCAPVEKNPFKNGKVNLNVSIRVPGEVVMR